MTDNFFSLREEQGSCTFLEVEFKRNTKQKYICTQAYFKSYSGKRGLFDLSRHFVCIWVGSHQLTILVRATRGTNTSSEEIFKSAQVSKISAQYVLLEGIVVL